MSDYQDMMRCLWKSVADTDQQIDAAAYIEELETKLAKAVTLAEKSMKWLRLYGADVHREASTLAELKGEK